jgi:hypothetical protein
MSLGKPCSDDFAIYFCAKFIGELALKAFSDGTFSDRICRDLGPRFALASSEKIRAWYLAISKAHTELIEKAAKQMDAQAVKELEAVAGVVILDLHRSKDDDNHT